MSEIESERWAVRVKMLEAREQLAVMVLEGRADWLLGLSEERVMSERRLEDAQAVAAERVAEQRAHASAAAAEATRLREELRALQMVTPADGDVQRHILEQLDKALWEREQELTVALGLNSEGCQLWSDLIAVARRHSEWARERDEVERRCREALDQLHDVTDELDRLREQCGGSLPGG